MKNLFLPFVVVALFAIGSCGDEASINPPVEGKDTTKELNQLDIISLTPDSAYVGEKIRITGKNFSTKKEENKVWFSPSIPAVIDSATSTQLHVRVPVGAVSGTIIISNGKYSDTSSTSFKILKPQIIRITDFFPKMGYDGAIVTISGVNFGADKTKAYVYFNGVEAEITAISKTIIKVKVPKDAKSGLIRVKIYNEETLSDSIFTVIPRPFPVIIKKLDSVSTQAIPYLSYTKSNGAYGDYDTTRIKYVIGFIPSSEQINVTQTASVVTLSYYSEYSMGDPRDITTSTTEIKFDIDYTQQRVSNITYHRRSSGSVVHTAGPTSGSSSNFSLAIQEAQYTVSGGKMVIEPTQQQLQNVLQTISDSGSAYCCGTSKLNYSFVSMLPVEVNGSFKIILTVE